MFYDAKEPFLISMQIERVSQSVCGIFVRGFEILNRCPWMAEGEHNFRCPQTIAILLAQDEVGKNAGHAILGSGTVGPESCMQRASGLPEFLLRSVTPHWEGC